MNLNLNFNRKGILFIMGVILSSGSLTGYMLYEQNKLNVIFVNLSESTEAVEDLESAQLSAFNAVAKLIVLFRAKNREEAVNITHKEFLNLLVNYEKITEIYPQKKDQFKSFLKSLAETVNKPTGPGLAKLSNELNKFRIEIEQLLKEVKTKRNFLNKSYTEGIQHLLINVVTIGTIAVLIFAIIVSIFFKGLTGDIKTLNFSLGRILDSSSKPTSVFLKRDDELKQLADKIGELSERLAERERSLSLEQRRRAHLEQNRALEHLTRGLVHAIGNPVAGLIGLIQQLRKNSPREDQTQQALLAMEESAQRLVSINEDLKHLSSRTGKERELLDLKFILSEHLKLISYDDDWFGININFKAADNLPVFSCSKDDITIIVENLLENALDAFKRAETIIHNLTIETFCKDDDCLGFIVSDNADGMPHDVQKHALDAFYSTKNKNGNEIKIGMGLLICLHVVEKYAGKIEFFSEEGVGTSVTVSFPVFENLTVINSGNQQRRAGFICIAGGDL